MRMVPLVLALVTGPAFSGDFRSHEFGASCNDVVAREIALGAKKLKWRDEGFAFEGFEFDRRLVFMYFCPNGALLTGDYLFPAEPLPDAVASYEAAHRELSINYGAPILDNTPWMQPKVNPRLLETDPTEYKTTWNSTRANVTMIFLPSRDNEPPGWRVAIHFSEPLALKPSDNSRK